MNRKTLLLATSALTVAVVAFLVLFAGYINAPHKSTDPAEDGRTVLYWTDPMVPGYRSDKPGKSPFMDMELVPVYADGAGDPGAAPVVTVRPEILNSLGVRTHTVTRSRPTHRIAVSGYLLSESGPLQLVADVFGREGARLRAGLPAEVTLPDLPGRRFRGVVSHVEPDLEVGLRSLKVRIRLLETDAALAPNLFAEAFVQIPAPGAAGLYIPREALIRTGTRTAVVLAVGEGRFQPAEVVPGNEAGDMIEIRRGLQDGDKVVTSGQFLIDSEANVRASMQRMTAPPDASKPDMPAPRGDKP